jgi:hypothetical protein
MTVTTREVSAVKTKLFPEEKWEEISGRVAEAFRMTAGEQEALRGGMIARLIAAIPFLAGCEEAERTAVAHLGTYLLSIKETKPYFNAHDGDTSTVLERLRLISDFKGGNSAIVDKGMSLLALNMVADYKRDIEEDARLGKYNPIAAGVWDFESTVESLEWKIATTPCEEMDDIAPIGASTLSFWCM